jgi:hypothetical protein
MFEVVNTYKEPAYVKVGECYTIVPLVSTLVPKPDGGDTAIRISGVPVLCGEIEAVDEAQLDELEPSKDYYVLDIEHSPVPDDPDEMEDAEPDWQSYLVLIVNAANLQDIDVVDPETGRSFSEAELMEANIVLSRIRRQLRDEEFECHLYLEAEESANSVFTKEEMDGRIGEDEDEEPQSGFAPFEKEKFIMEPGCDPCFSQGIRCSHVRPLAKYN